MVVTVLAFVLILSLLGLSLIVYMIILGKNKNKKWDTFSKDLDLDFLNVLESLYIEEKHNELYSLVVSNLELDNLKQIQFAEWKKHEIKIKRIIKLFWNLTVTTLLMSLLLIILTYKY